MHHAAMSSHQLRRPSVPQSRGTDGRLAHAHLRAGAPRPRGGSRAGRAAQGAPAVALLRRARRTPAGWLFRVARNGALDVLRRNASFAVARAEIAAELSAQSTACSRASHDSAIEDDELRMVFMCCHPSLPPDARVALSLKTVGGFSVAGDRARISGRPSRRSRSGSCAPSGAARAASRPRLPHGSDSARALDSVLEVIYLLFNGATTRTPATI